MRKKNKFSPAFIITNWLRWHKAFDDDDFLPGYMWIPAGAVFEFFTDTRSPQTPVISAQVFGRELVTAGVERRHTRNGSEYRFRKVFNIPDSYIENFKWRKFGCD